MSSEQRDKPEIFVNFENKLSDLLAKAVTYGVSRKITQRSEVVEAAGEVYGLFYDIVEQASYLQETVRLMHEMEEETK